MLLPILRNTEDWLDNSFDDVFNDSWMPTMSTAAPAINVKENDKEYNVEVAAPGARKEDFNVNVTDDNYLVLTMEKKNETKDEDKKRKYLRREFSYHKFEQSLALPEDVNKDEIKASVNDGILTIDIPKVKATEKQPAVKQIEIQ